MNDLQKKELEILKEFIRVCDKLKLNYYMAGGSLIGVIRHKGFIPWDDDIDVCMLRKDYEEFLKKAQPLLKKNYFLQTYETEPGYTGNFAKIRDSKTTFIESSVKKHKINHGIYIDIFPLDNRYKYNKIKLKLLDCQIYKTYTLDFKKTFKYRIKLLISNMIYGRKTTSEICRLKDRIFTKKNNIKMDKCICYSGAWGIEKETHYISDFEDTIKKQFEDVIVTIPKGYDRVLKDTYGDYMQLPPIEKRKPHHYSEIIDTKKSYLKYIDEDKKQ